MDIAWKKIGERALYSGYRKVVGKTFLLPDGRQAEFDIHSDPDTVCVVAFTPENEVVLAKQFRPGPEMPIVELPGGIAESGRAFKNQAERELMEETGYQGDLEFVGEYLTDCYSTRHGHVFIGHNCRKVAEPRPGGSEFIQVVKLSLSQFRKHLRSGQISDVQAGYMALDYLGLL